MGKEEGVKKCGLSACGGPYVGRQMLLDFIQEKISIRQIAFPVKLSAFSLWK